MSFARRIMSLCMVVALVACGGNGDEPIEEPVVPTDAPQTTADAPQTTSAAEVDFGDDGAATDFLAAIFMPRDSVTDAQVDCINEEMESYPDGLPALGSGRDEALSEIVEACELIPGG